MTDVAPPIYSNQTLFALQSSSRYAWTGFNIFLLFSSLVGDSIILVASIKYNAFKLHKMSVVLIQHMAICDLMLAMTLILPTIVSLTSNEWVLGSTMCFLQPYFVHLGYTGSIYFTLAMTTTKLIILKNPFLAREWSRKKAHLICVLIWIFSLAVDLMVISTGPKDAYFDYRRYCCRSGLSAPIWRIVLLPLVALFVGILPVALVIITTLMLLWKAWKITRRGGKNLKLEGVLTVVLTATVFTISFLPYTTYHIGSNFAAKDPLSTYHVLFFTVASNIMSINIMCNFYIYSLTVHSYRQFLVTRLGLANRKSPDISGDTALSLRRKDKEGLDIELNIERSA
ncbi:cysteinyl leukotriene receptor 1-like [Bolinopsis microptera]|uniref:cysteinyl leukotriene receptor 1-like n=1 Tax=Bolinopsis microptera TaxID=2820187 RepID=UPI00307AAB24